MKGPSEELVDLASFQLREAARVWKETSPPVHTWEEFKTAFLNRFLPEGLRDAKRQAFEDLWMTPDMIVTQFELIYTELSQYATNIVLTEREKIKKVHSEAAQIYVRSVDPTD